MGNLHQDENSTKLDKNEHEIFVKTMFRIPNTCMVFGLNAKQRLDFMALTYVWKEAKIH